MEDPAHSAYDAVYAYTIGREAFILQHVVDAHAAQTANERSKPIGIIFALIGLYLHVERQFSGVEVQRVHMRLGRERRSWPTIRLPEGRGDVTAAHVLDAAPGPARDQAIDDWCRSVWQAFRESRQTIVDLVNEYHVA